MLRMRSKTVIILFSLLFLCNCIDPYTPKLTGYESVLVVDGLVTDANSSYKVKLSRAFQDLNTIPSGVAGATVYISDDRGTRFNLTEKGEGIYATDSLAFKGVQGTTYILHISTKEGEEYESDRCTMQPVPAIDKIYYGTDQQIINNGTVTQDGISIYLDSKAGNSDQYYRWAFEETWKFKVPSPKKYDYKMADSSFIPVADIKDYCWKNKKSDGILIYSNISGQSLPVRKMPLLFIATDQSDRLLIQYSILVNQYSISKKEYDFWDNLKQINEDGGDLFAKQPYTVISNIKNIKNPTERVLGYFQVSAVSQKRIYITFAEVATLKIPVYHYPCVELIKEPNDYPNAFMAPPPTWNDLYSMFCVTSDYYFVEPYFSSAAGGKKNISKMVFTRPECSNCELTGVHKKPDFWVDLQ
jgi:hypothetical protein